MNLEKKLLADGQRYLVTTNPEREGDLWRIRGRRWIKTRQQWSQKGLSFRCHSFEWEEPIGLTAAKQVEP